MGTGKLLKILGGVLLVAAGGFVMSSVDASAVTKKLPSITVSPATNLMNGQSVKVSGSNFVPKDSLYIVECLLHASGQKQCNIVSISSAKASSTGVLAPTTFHVITGKIGTGTCGTSKTDLAACDISVGTIQGTDTATAPIKFMAPSVKK
ncbi:MAG: neocarzinostatin apoprotein domain-containing protein [Actinomycetota bacterium]|jgi:hypothetical protein